MNPAYLLDSSVCIPVLRNQDGLGKLPDPVRTGVPVIVAAELRYGAAKKGSERLTAQLECVLAALPILPLEEPADVAYGQLRAQLEVAGTPIGGNDMLIAAQAMSSGCSVVTDNEREFARINGLTVVNWLR